MGTISELKHLQSLEKSSSSVPGKDEVIPSKNINYIEWDPVSNMPLPHLMFMCEALLPAHIFDGSESQKMSAALEKVITTVLDKLNVNADIVIGGDPADGLTVPQRELQSHSGSNDQPIEILMVVPDVSIGPTDEYQIQTSDGGTRDFHIVSCDNSKQHLSALKFTDIQQAKEKVEEAVGLATNGRWKHKVNIALRCCSQKDNGTQQGEKPNVPCHVVPTEDPTIWNYSFVAHMHSISAHLTPMQRQAFAIIKVLMCEELDLPAVLTLEHARMIFFKICEGNEATSIPAMMKLLGVFFHQSLACLVNCSLLHSFIPNLDLLHPSPNEDIVQTVIHKLVNVRQSPMTYLLKHYSKVNVAYGIELEQLFNIIEPIMEDCKNNKMLKNLNQSIASVIVPACQKLICSLVMNSLDTDQPEEMTIMKRAFNMCELCNNMWNSVLPIPHPIKSLHLLTAFSFVKPVAASIRLYEYVLDVYGAYGNELSDLACLYHAYIHTQPSGERDNIIQKTKQIFLRAFSTADKQGKLYDSYIDFCTFLCRMNMQKEALEYLEIEIAKNTEELQFRHSYRLEEMDTVDERLQQEITHSTDKVIFVESGVYIRYLKAQCLLKLEKLTDMPPLVQEMLQRATQIPQNEIKALQFNMAGYIYMDAGLFDDAIQVFQQVLDFAPENICAEEHLMQCYALKLSLETSDQEG